MINVDFGNVLEEVKGGSTLPRPLFLSRLAIGGTHWPMLVACSSDLTSHTKAFDHFSQGSTRRQTRDREERQCLDAVIVSVAVWLLITIIMFDWDRTLPF